MDHHQFDETNKHLIMEVLQETVIISQSQYQLCGVSNVVNDLFVSAVSSVAQN